MSGGPVAGPPPYVYRAMFPYLVSLLSFVMEPVIAGTLLNIIMLLALNIIIYKLCLSFDISPFSSLVVALVCSVSFPVAYYGAAFLTDTGLMMCAAIFVYYYGQTKNDMGLLIFLGIYGVLFKEVMLFFLLMPIMHNWRDWKNWVLFIIPAATYLWLRILFHGLPLVSDWIFNVEAFMPDRLITTIGTMGITMIVLLPLFIIGMLDIGFLYNKDACFKYLKCGIPVLAIPIIGLFFAWFDGRFLWPLYIIMAPFAARGVESLRLTFRPIWAPPRKSASKIQG